MKDRTIFSIVWVVVVIVMTNITMQLVEDAYGSAMGYLTYILFWVGLSFGAILKYGIDNTEG